MSTKNDTHTKSSILTQWTTWVCVAISAALLLVANSGLWVNRYIFNAESFTKVMTQSLTSSTSRSAIADSAADRAFEGRPIAARLLKDTASNLIEGLLASDQATKALRLTAERTNVLLTSKEKKPIVLDLSAIKNMLGLVSNIAAKVGDTNTLDVEKIPDTVTIVDTTKLPDLYGYSLLALWMAPLAFIGALIGFAIPHLRAKDQEDRINLLFVQAGAIALVGIAGLAIGPLFRPVILANIVDALPRTVVATTYDAFIATFNAQTSMFIWVALLLSAVALSAKLGLKYWSKK